MKTTYEILSPDGDLLRTFRGTFCRAIWYASKHAQDEGRGFVWLVTIEDDDVRSATPIIQWGCSRIFYQNQNDKHTIEYEIGSTI